MAWTSKWFKRTNHFACNDGHGRIALPRSTLFMQGLGEVADVNKCDIKKLSCSAGNFIRFSVMNGLGGDEVVQFTE